MKIKCRQCKRDVPHLHLHNCAHGIPETHMAGSERYECTHCKCTTYAHDNIEGFKFYLDKPEERPQ